MKAENDIAARRSFGDVSSPPIEYRCRVTHKPKIAKANEPNTRMF